MSYRRYGNGALLFWLILAVVCVGGWAIKAAWAMFAG